MMSAEVIPFPRALDRTYVVRQAREISRRRTAAGGVRYLADLLDAHRKHLWKLGVSRARTSADVARLEGAIRAELWRVVLAPQGAA